MLRFDGFTLPGIRSCLTAALFAASLVAVPIAATAVEPGAACAVGKRKAASTRLSEKLNCYAKALLKDVAVDPVCLSQAEARFIVEFARLESKGNCVTVGDAAMIGALVDSWLQDLQAILPSSTAATTTTTTTTTSTTSSTSTTTTSTSTSTTTTSPCISSGQSCTLDGTPCCSGLTCYNTEAGPTSFQCVAL